jgi:hypothetical protein
VKPHRRLDSIYFHPDISPQCLVPKADAHTESYDDNVTHFLGMLVVFAMVSMQSLRV